VNYYSDAAFKLPSSVMLHNCASQNSHALDFNDFCGGDDGIPVDKANYSSFLQKYSLRVNENGCIDAIGTREPIAFVDYLPRLLNVTTFSRVLGIVYPQVFEVEYICFDLF
jgi:hypothetical protein